MRGVTATAEEALLAAVAAGTSDDPFSALGRHWADGTAAQPTARADGPTAQPTARADGTTAQPTVRADGTTAQPTARADKSRRSIVVRTMQTSADAVDLLVADRAAAEGPDAGRPDAWRTVPMTRRLPEGLFEATVPAVGDTLEALAYRFRVHDRGETREVNDPYQFGPVLTEFDLHLFAEGTHLSAWKQLGARRRTIGVITGVHFAVWAPNAQRVSVIGDFNRWDGRMHAMRKLFPTGIWEVFVPDLPDGACYKFEVRTSGGHLLHKADPYGRRFEVPPNTASLVWDDGGYAWRDGDWMRDRAAGDGWRERPMSIYEMHPGSWRRIPEEGNRPLTYRELASELVPYLREMGFTHLELLPVMEHPFSGSWGYQVIGFYAPTSRFGTPDDFRFLVDECHRYGIGVILDWVPGHFPKDRHGLAQFDGTALYEHADPRKGEHQDWGTLVFNYGRNEVRSFLLSNALFWLEEFHIDGLRVDAVASMLYLDYSRESGQWIPNQFGGRENLEAVEFLKQLNTVTHGRAPGTITIAEESTSWPAVSRPVYVGGLGFSYKWNMGWMHDMLEYVEQDPVHRRWLQGQITFSMLYAFTENFVLPFSHDEVVHGKRSMLDKMPGDVWQKHATLRALYGFMFGHPGKKLLFMGSEFGQWREWNHDASLDWHLLDDRMHAGMQRWVRDLNQVYQRERALHEIDFDGRGFSWIDCHDNENSVISLVRRAKQAEDHVVIVVNFTPVPRPDYRIGVPDAGWYREILNSDAAVYGGGNIGNGGGVSATDQPMHGFPHSLSLSVPPLGIVFLKR